MRTGWILSGVLAIGCLISIAPAVAQTSACGARGEHAQNDQAAVVDTVCAMYRAATADDIAGLDKVFAPGFYMYDNGSRFEGDSIMKPLDAQRAKGWVYVWDVTEPDVHVHGDQAWIAFVNRGSVKAPGDAAATPETWLESAYLERQGGVWKMVFFHSTRVVAAK